MSSSVESRSNTLTHRNTDKQTSRQTDRHPHKHTNIQTTRQTSSSNSETDSGHHSIASNYDSNSTSSVGSGGRSPPGQIRSDSPPRLTHTSQTASRSTTIRAELQPLLQSSSSTSSFLPSDVASNGFSRHSRSTHPTGSSLTALSSAPSGVEFKSGFVRSRHASIHRRNNKLSRLVEVQSDREYLFLFFSFSKYAILYI